MTWISLAVGAACGVLAAATAAAIVKDRKENKSRYSIVFVVTLVVLLAVAREFVTPKLQASYAASTLDESLSGNPAFAAIKQYDAPTYSRILSETKVAISQGKSELEAKAAIRNNITALVQQRLPRASDEAAVAYMRVMVQEMTELNKHEPDTCFRFLFPEAGQPIDLERFIPDALERADLAALREIVRTSATAPQAVPTEAEVSPLLEPIVQDLVRHYGQDLVMLEEPTAPGVDKRKVCLMTIATYTRILQLPPAQGGKLVRFMLSQS